MKPVIEVTLKGKGGVFKTTLVPTSMDSWDSLAWRALVELQKQGKPVTKYDRVSFREVTS